MAKCDRCKQETVGTIGSYFNTDILCFECRQKEEAHPKFEEARKADWEACQRGDYNFPGIGLPADLR